MRIRDLHGGVALLHMIGDAAASNPTFGTRSFYVYFRSGRKPPDNPVFHTYVEMQYKLDFKSHVMWREGKKKV